MNKTDDTLVAHLGELRKRVLWTLVVFLLGIIFGFIYAEKAIKFIMNQKPLSGITFSVFSPGETIQLYMNFCVVVGLIITLPMALYQIWAFVKPGLREEEQKTTLALIPLVFILFLFGFAFGYFIVVPLVTRFSTNISKKLGVNEVYGISQYVTFMIKILLPTALIFELPVIIPVPDNVANC